MDMHLCKSEELSCFLGKYPEIIIGIRSGSIIIKQPHVWPETARVAIMLQELNRPDRGKNWKPDTGQVCAKVGILISEDLAPAGRMTAQKSWIRDILRLEKTWIRDFE